jgi:hypothetical protein
MNRRRYVDDMLNTSQPSSQPTTCSSANGHTDKTRNRKIMEKKREISGLK